MEDICASCGGQFAPHVRSCQICGADVGFPNVREATRHAETDALQRRVEAARASAEARGVTPELDQFEEAVGASKAVMNRWLGPLLAWVNGDSPLFLPFYKQVEHLGRVPEDTEWDKQRESAESAINPFIYRELSIAALSLNDTGLVRYGNYTVVFKDQLISARATVFEENPFYFNRKHNVGGGPAPPRGYRAAWAERSQLAVAKLQPKLRRGMTATEFAAILMEPRTNDPDCDFIEVHIYGPMHRLTIESVRGPVPKRRADKLLWKRAKRKLVEAGASVVEA
jgi:hypothetical protein